MKKLLTNHALMILGWCFVLLGLVGVVLPILPTTPFMIIAATLLFFLWRLNEDKEGVE